MGKIVKIKQFPRNSLKNSWGLSYPEGIKEDSGNVLSGYTGDLVMEIVPQGLLIRKAEQ